MAENPVYMIPDKVCEKAGINAKWLPGERLAVYAYRHKTANSEDKRSEFAPCKALIHDMRFKVIIFDPIVCKLINESNGTFLVAQKIAEKTTGSSIRIEMLKLSRQYRSIVRACLENLQVEESKAENSRKEAYKNLIAIFYNVEFLWHLCEILYIDIIPGDMVVPHLMEWIRFHFFHCERQAATIMGNLMAGEGAENEPEYWETVIGLVLQGRLDGARTLLKAHSCHSMEAFEAADIVMRTMPKYNAYGGLSVAEFNLRWKEWQVNTVATIEAGAFVSQPEVELIMKVMVGDGTAFQEAKQYCSTWYQYMAAWLFYTEPTVKSFDLSFHAIQSVSQYGGMSKLKESDLILLAIMESDLHQVIKLILSSSENGWFAAHLTDLLYHCDCLSVVDKHQDNVTQNLRDQLLLDYGSLLMTHHSLWQVGVSYLDHCHAEGRAQLELLLPTLPLTSEARTLKIIQVAREREMHHIVSSICKIMGMRSYQQHRLGNALTWALRSQDGAFATFLADKFLELYSQEGKFHSTDLLENLGSCMLVSDRLTFLGKYCEFHQMYRSGEFREAAGLLVNLLESRLAPKSFWMVLLMDALPLLESNDIVLTSYDTYVLMSCLEELVSEGKVIEMEAEKIKTSQAVDASINDDKIKLIRLALARNLARSINHEACLPD